MRRGISYARRDSETPPGPTLSELSAKCAERFVSPDYVVRPDDGHHTVWVSVSGGRLSVGIQPSAVERRGLERTLDDAEARLLAK